MANAVVAACIDTAAALQNEPALKYNAILDERAKTLRAGLEAAQAKLSAYQRESERFRVLGPRRARGDPIAGFAATLLSGSGCLRQAPDWSLPRCIGKIAASTKLTSLADVPSAWRSKNSRCADAPTL
jgi:hypothetical protein